MLESSGAPPRACGFGPKLATSSENEERSPNGFPRFIHESSIDTSNLPLRSMQGKTRKSRNWRFPSSSRARSVTNSDSCSTGAIRQRTAPPCNRTNRATSTETMEPLRRLSRLRHLPPRRTIETSPGNIAAICPMSSSRRACVLRRRSIEPNWGDRPYPINS